MQFDRFMGTEDTADTAETANYIDAPLASGTTQAASAGTVVAYPYTGDYRVDVLLDSDPGNLSVTSRWNYGSPLGTPETITYSFMNSVPSYGGNQAFTGATGFRVFTPQQIQVAGDIFKNLTLELGINFVEVPDGGSGFGQIRLGQNDQSGASTAGYTWLPNSGDDNVAGYGLSGDVWIDYTYAPNHTLSPGSEGLETLVHEIGHALGLKHPGDYNAGDTGTSSLPGNYLGAAEDNTNYTVMSYTYTDQPRDWYGTYDLLALKALYGADSAFNAGATTYSYTDTDGRILKIIDDASGSDTINLSALTLGATVDLRPGAFSSIGRDFFGAPAVGNLSIDLQTSIENVTGTNYADHIILNSGTASAYGGFGIDTVQYMSSRAAYTVTPSGNSLHVTGGGMDDSLTTVERLQFSDGKFAFDFSGNAGMTAKILGVIFHQGSTPDPA
ncbi:MAG: M10 family metallopeptidase C-terminal domain-containing protein, partial [Ramlibacter sp.]|nr:M10 family metallopeptidase C-terminal domain-containing protein [Ramlibacter sp.]